MSLYATLQEAITAANAVAAETDVKITVKSGEYTGLPVSGLEQQTASFGELTKANTELSVASGAQVTLKGTIQINAENAISVFANAVTLTGNEFTQAANIGEAFVTNGIVLYPQTPAENNSDGVAVSYTVTGNTFTGITKATADGVTSTPIIIRENFSDNSQLGGKPATATIKDFISDNEIATKNTFTGCVGGEYYVRLNGSNYVYSSVYGKEETVAAVKATKENGSVLTGISSTDLQDGLKDYTSALSSNLSIQCSDILVVNDEATVKTLAKQGKYVLDEQR